MAFALAVKTNYSDSDIPVGSGNGSPTADGEREGGASGDRVFEKSAAIDGIHVFYTAKILNRQLANPITASDSMKGEFIFRR